MMGFDAMLMVHFGCVQEEKEKRLEEELENELDNAFENRYAPKEEVPEEGAVALAGKKSKETLSATDTVIDALDMAEVELTRIADHEVLVPIILIWSLIYCELED